MMTEYLEQNTALAISLAASAMIKIQEDIGWFQTNLKHEEGAVPIKLWWHQYHGFHKRKDKTLAMLFFQG
jgi:hypothetical protein